MKTISLRVLLREPLKVKLMTGTGKPVQITDNGRPLWIIHPAVPKEDQKRRRSEIETELAAILREPMSELSLSKIILDSRR
jgi:hypothetical protein